MGVPRPVTPLVGLNKNLRLIDRNHKSFVFVGSYPDENKIHTAYSTDKSKMIGSFITRPVLVLTQTNNGYYQIKELAQNTFLFVGSAEDENGNHFLSSVKEENAGSKEEFFQKTSMVLEEADGGFRIKDKNFNCYWFVGNGVDTSNDHTVYASLKKDDEFSIRTIFDVEYI
jgi:hypothetical protein